MDGADNSDCGQAMSSSDKVTTSGDQKSEDNGEDSSSKHLKKARFVWQIKGNYHLKNSSSESEVNQVSDFSLSEASSSTAQESVNCNADSSSYYQSSNKTGLSSTTCDHHPLTSQSNLDATSSKSCEEPYPPLPPLRIGATSVSCVVCDTFNENIRRASLNVDGEQPSFTPPLPTSHPDWNVRKWQTRQIAMAFMDNTINCLLEDLGFTPLPESAPDSDPDDILGSINFPSVNGDVEEEEDESVENEGILSAIQRHGLQRHRLQPMPEVSHRYQYSPRQSTTRCSPSPPNIWGPSDQLVFKTLSQADGSPSSQESASLGSDVEMSPEEPILSPANIEAVSCNKSDGEDNIDFDANETHNNFVASSACRCTFLNKNVEDSHVGLSTSFPSSAGSSDHETSSESSEENDTSELSDFHTHSSHECSPKLAQENESCKKRQSKEVVSSSLSKRKYINPPHEASMSSSSPPLHVRSSSPVDSGPMAITSNSSDRYSPTFGHFEFMDAAVAAAIQKKGLSALACQDL